ncbi:Planctomycete cytochrome C, partial [Durusdinium trenchii]
MNRPVSALVAACLLLVSVCWLPQVAHAQLKPEHRRELYELNRSVGRVAGMIRKKEFDAASDALEEAATRVEEIASDAGIETSDRALKGVLTAIERQKAALAKASGTAKPDTGVSFAGDVAPIINARCVRCHGENNPRNGLRLDAFAGWKRGGQGGVLLVPGNARRSLLMARLMAPEGQGRMPAGGEALDRDELETIATWINQGAKYDGGRDSLPLADVIYQHELKASDVQIPKPKGTETVSFTQDIAPWMANLCLGCHNERRKSGGLSVATFFDIMKGGDSGAVIEPGDMENSRLFRLGQARITRKNYEDLKQWFVEGNTFDGDNPRTPLANYRMTPQQMAANQFASKSEAEMRELRSSRTEQQIKRAISSDPIATVQRDAFLVTGTVSEQRLNEVGDWAESHLERLQKTLGGSGAPWRGRLAVIVLRDRFSYEEFNQIVESRRIPTEMVGHSKVTVGYEDAYVALQDVGDTASSENPGLQASLIQHVTAAYLSRDGAEFPAWLSEGLGLYLAAGALPGNQYIKNLSGIAASQATALRRPRDVFDDGTFSPAFVGPVGYTLVDFLMDGGGPAKFRQLLKSLSDGRGTGEALSAVYG